MRRLVAAFTAAILSISTVVSPAVAAGPTPTPSVLVSEGFESGTTPSYTTTRVVSYPADGNAYWAPITLRAKSGAQGLWCAGTLNPTALPIAYSQWSAGLATFEVPGTTDFYSATAEFDYLLPSRGTGDSNSFAVQWAPADGSGGSDGVSAFPVTSAWKRVQVPLAGWAPISRRPSRVYLQWIDFSDPVNPVTGEGPTVDDFAVTGWKYGPARSLTATAAGSRVSLGWQRPWRSSSATSTEERPISYRVYHEPAGTGLWSEDTAVRLSDPAAGVAYSAAVPGEGAPYTYAVQAWDAGSGAGYGVVATATVTPPAIPPTVSMATPAPGFALTGAPVTISGTSGDVGTGVSAVEVRIRRADGSSWNGVSWAASDAWVPASSGDGWATWSYGWTPDSFTLAAGGIVTVTARATDGAGLMTSTTGVPSSPPISASVSVEGGAAYTTTALVTASISAPGATVMRWRINGGSYTAWTTYATSAPLDLGSGDGTKLVDFDFSADGGSTVAATASDSIVLHTSVPAVSISAPAAGFSLNTGAVSITGAASDAGGSVAAVDVRIARSADGKYWNGSTWVAGETWVPAQSSNGYAGWSYSWTPDASTLAGHGMVTIAARATDAFGLTGASDPVGSGVPVGASILVDAGAAYTTSAQVPVSIAATGSVNWMRWAVDRDPGAGDTWLPFAAETTVTLTPGDGTKSVRFDFSVDMSTIATSAADSIVLHTSVPAVSISGPSANFPITSAAVAISGTASDVGTTVAGVKLRIRRADGLTFNGLAWDAAENWLPASSTDGFATWNYTWTPGNATLLAKKIVTLTARATDAAGLAGDSGSVSSAVPGGTQPPIIPGVPVIENPAVAIAGGAQYTSRAGVDLAISATNATQMRVNNGPWVPYATSASTTLPAGDGVKSVVVDFSLDGSPTVGATAVDEIILDGTVPTVSIAQPVPGFALSGPVAVSATGTDAISGVGAVEVRIERAGLSWNGIGWQPAEKWLPAQLVAGAWTYLWSPDPATAAGYLPVTVSAAAKDNAGNASAVVSVKSIDPLDPTELAVAPAPVVVAWGAPAAVSATLTASGAPLSRRTVSLQQSVAGVWKSVASAITTGTGRAAFSVRPTSKTTYRVRFAGDATYAAALGPAFTVTPRVALSTPAVPISAARNTAFAVSGTLKPRHASGTSPVKVYAYQRSGRVWLLRKTVSARVSAYSTYSLYKTTISLPAAGDWRLRAYAPADAAHAATWGSWTRTITVR